MGDYPIGTYRTQTCNETISNWKGTNVGNIGGAGAVRVFAVFLSVLTTGANAAITLRNGVSAAVTNTVYATVRCQREFTAKEEFAEGMLFPNGCFITTAGAIDYATVTFRAELL